MLGLKSSNDFKGFFFKHFVWAEVFANRGDTQVRVIFTANNWEHVFWRGSDCFDLQRAERMPWILEALRHPEEIRQAYKGKRDVYILTEQVWGEDFCVVVKMPNTKGVSHFVTAYPPDLKSMLKIRACNPKIWP